MSIWIRLHDCLYKLFNIKQLEPNKYRVTYGIYENYDPGKYGPKEEELSGTLRTKQVFDVELMEII